MRTGFSKNERLHDSFRINELFKKGKKYACSGVSLFVLPNDLSFNRIVFSLGRKYGNAVMRNRSKRLSRAVYRSFKSRLVQGYDFSLLVYPGKDDFYIRQNQLDDVFKKAGLLTKQSEI